MEKISVSNIVVFKRKKTEGSKLTLLTNLRKPKQKKEEDESGGNYWVHSLSTIGNVFASNKLEQIGEKIDHINEKLVVTKRKQTKDMYGKNLEILHNFEEFDFSTLKPKNKLTFLHKPNEKSIVNLRNVPVQVRPQHVFTFIENKETKVGAVWFVSKLKGYSAEELGMFADAMFRYLKINYGDQFEIAPKFCSVVDATNTNIVNYSQILSNQVPPILNETLDEISKLI